MSKAIGVIVDGNVEWHAHHHGVGDYNTLCGIDADDPNIGHEGTVEAKRGQKITCQTCREIWRGTVALNLRESSFSLGSE